MSEKTVEVTEENFKEEVLDADKIVVVDFWAPWCGPCKMITPVLEELAEEYGDKIKVAKVNVDNNQGLAQKYQVSSIPNLLFFNNGESVDEQVGFTSKEALVEKIDNLL
ncbi:MAG: thioredoxin [Bacillota bacterium]